jgi:tetratricopeptide (TPR) repeat protein
MTLNLRGLVCVLLIIGWCGCSTRMLVINELTDIIDTGVTAFEQDDDLQMLEEAFPANIKLLEAVLANDPDNERLLVLLARLYGSYAFVFFEDRLEAAVLTGAMPDADQGDPQALEQAAVRYYALGIEYALRALEVRYPGCREKLAKVPTAGRFIESLDSADVPPLFWYGFNLSAYVNHNRDSVRAIARAHLIEKTMKRVLALDPDYYYGSAHLVLMAYYASRSPMMGGNIDLAARHYQGLKEMHGHRFLLADLFYARYYLYQKQDRRQFVQVLTSIIGHGKGDKQFRLFNTVAEVRAQTYLTAVDQLFDE